MGKSLSILALGLVGSMAVLPMASADAGETSSLAMSIKVDQSASRTPEIAVQGSDGRYDKISAASFSLSLSLNARLDTDASTHKIIASEAFLKAAGSDRQASSVNTGKDLAPSPSVAIDQSFDFSIEPQGPVAQKAIAMCNGLPSSERSAEKATTLSLALPVVWRATTGRFNFNWTNYDRVSPSKDIYNNLDFYADRQTVDTETTIEARLVCQPLTVAKVATAAASAPVAPSKVKADAAAAPSPASTNSIEPQQVVAKPAAVTTASNAGTGKPACEGGMLREMTSGQGNYLCLCPGNTERVETSENAFACEKKANRR